MAGEGIYAISEITGDSITYSNTKSGLTSTDVEVAIDELYDKTKNLEIKYAVGAPNIP